MKRRSAKLTVVTEEVALPNGVLLELDMVRHPGAAAIVPFVSEHEILLIRQFRHAAGGTIYEVPAGKLEAGESPAACAARELREEAGQEAGRLVHLGSILTTPGFTDERIHLFSAHDLRPAPAAHEADELIEVVPVALAQALEWVWSGALDDAKSALALIHAARRAGALT